MKEKRYPNRLQIFVDQDMENLLADLASMNGVTISAIVRDLLETLTPGLRTTLDMMKTAKNLDAQARQTLSATLQEHADKLKRDTDYVMESVKKDIANV